MPSAYTTFLLATALGKDRAVGVAAVLPCFWLYAQVGAALPAVPAEHPYAAWLDTYRDPGFVTATEQALAQLESEMAAASPAVRTAAARAYLTACRHELEFFDQALRIEPGGGAALPAATSRPELAGSARRRPLPRRRPPSFTCPRRARPPCGPGWGQLNRQHPRVPAADRPGPGDARARRAGRSAESCSGGSPTGSGLSRATLVSR